MSLKLFSEAGRVYERSRKIKPKHKTQRQRMYSSCHLKSSTDHAKTEGIKKFSPFNTTSRSSRDSFLLRVTKEPNTQTNYHMNYNSNMKKGVRPTIDKASFKRVIGPMNQNDFSVEVKAEGRDHRCVKSFSERKEKRPLTARETHNWRKSHQNLNFSKQLNPERASKAGFLNQFKSASDSVFIETLKQTGESNFNNYNRFSFKSRTEKSHNFTSDKKHQYLKEIENREIEPEYDTRTNKEDFFRISMKEPKGEMRFDTFREKVKVRKDRADPNWFQVLEYTPKFCCVEKGRRRMNFGKETGRQINEVHSKYPIRQSLQVQMPLRVTN